MIPLIQQSTTPLYMTDTTTYMLWKLTESPIYMLWHRYSNLAYSYTQQASLWSYDTPDKINTLYYYTGYSNLNDMILLIQQPTTPLYMTDKTAYMLWKLIESPI